MGILRIDHPDIYQFSSSKSDPHTLTNFNISVAITDDFISKVKKDKHVNLINPLTKEKEKELRAKSLLRFIAANAHQNADPGVIFVDRINKYNPTPQLGDISSTNPCGEIPLLPYEPCNLGSINLSKHMVHFIHNPWLQDNQILMSHTIVFS